MTDSSSTPAEPSTSGALIGGKTFEQYLAHNNRVMVRLTRLLFPPVMLWFRVRAYGQENIPSEGGMLFCPNHCSYLDPFIQMVPQPRQVRFMAKSSLYHVPVFRSLIFACGAFPVQRGKQDLSALEIARNLVERGEAVVVYPEGTRYRGADELGHARRGALRVAIHAKVPVVPVACYGLKPRKALGRTWWPPFGRVTVLYGAPMRFDQFPDTPDGAGAARNLLWAEVTRLYELARALDQGGRRPRRWTIPRRADDPSTVAQNDE